MKKRLALATAVVLGLLALAGPAQAKGEGGVITIKNGGSGPGGLPGAGGSGGGGGSTGAGSGAALLSSPIRISGRASAFWFEETGFGQAKSNRPMYFGKPIPFTQLGPGLAVTASFLCGPGNRHSVHQVVYPYANRGPQTYTPPGQSMCGMALHQGWWGAPYGQMLDTLTAHGLPKTLPAAFQPPAAGSGSAAMTNQPIAPAGTAWPLILAVLVGIGALVLTNAVVTRRRARLPA